MNYDAMKLRKVRLFLNLSQREISELIGVSRSSIYRYENELTPVSLKVRTWVNKLYRKHHLANILIKSSKDCFTCTFRPFQCYSIADNDKILHRLSLNPCIRDFSCNFVFQYLGSHGIHHCFREIHGNWNRTYTNSQLVDKRIQELPYYSSMTG